MSKGRKSKVVELRRTKASYMEVVRAALDGRGKLIWTPHVRQEAKNEDIPDRAILQVLSTGRVVEGPYQEIDCNWRCRHEGYAAGINLAVVTEIERLDGIEVVLITTFLV